MRFLSAVVGWSLRNRAIVLAASLILVVFGVRGALLLRVDAVPDVTPIQVQVVTSSPALSPVELEQYVTVPVERALASTPGSIEVRSLSKYGYSMVTVLFEDGADMYRARQLVAERLTQAQAQIPTSYGRPQLAPISSALGEIYQFVVRNDRLDAMKRRELLDWFVAPQLRAVAGVVDVGSLGGEEREYQIVVDPKRLQSASVSIEQITTALERSNANMGGGYIERNREQVIIGTNGLARSLDDFRKVVVTAPKEGPPLTLGMLAEVRFGPRLRRGAATRDGQGEVVVGVVIMHLGENARTVTAAVKRKLAAIQSSLPEGTTIEPFYDRSLLVRDTTATIGRNLVEGALLVIVILLLLLGDLRAGLVVAATIPLALLAALLVMNVAGLTGNLMSLGAVDFGLLVDGAVIIIENVVRRLSDAQASSPAPLTAKERIAIVESATMEVRAASVFGEAIIAVVYLPILTLTGVEGKLFLPMATTVLLGLGGAFVLTLTLVPVLASFVVKPHVAAREPLLFRLAERAYEPVLVSATRHRARTIGGACALLALGVLLFVRLGSDFVPQLDEGDLLIEVHRLTGVALTEALAVDLRIERSLLAIPEVAHVVGKLGAPEITTDPMGIDQTDMYVALKPRSAWRRGRSKGDVTQEIAERLARDVPDVFGGISQPIQMRTNELVAGFRGDVAIVLYGEDIDELVQVGNEIARVVRSVHGVVDTRVEQIAGLSYLHITPNRDRLAAYGLSVGDVNDAAEAISIGRNVGVVFEGDRRFGVVVKLAARDARDTESFAGISLKTMSGQMVPLGEVADLRVEDGPAEINRSAGSRRLAVEFNVRGRDLLSTVADAQRKVAALHLPVGYHAEWGGQFEHYVEGKRRLLVVVPLALALIVFFLWLAFRSVRTTVVVFLGVPFAIVGGVIALVVTSLPFSISAGIGFIALSGVAILNGLVLVSAARHLEAEGMPAAAAIESAARRRLRPVLMTALVAALGFIPMALSSAPGSEVQRPLATVVIGGIVSATLLTLIVLPVIYESIIGARNGRERR